jgi:hypothetical protein
MTVALDARSTLAKGTGDRNWDHTPVGTPRAALVIIADGVATDQVVGVTYGGTAMVQVAGSPLHNATGEAGSVHGFFLDAVAAGVQSVAIDRGDTSDYIAACYTVTGTGPCVVHDTSVSNSDADATPDAVLTITLPSFVAGGIYSGINGVGIDDPAPLAGSQNDVAGDFGTDGAVIGSGTSVKTGNYTYGWTQANNDATLLVVAIADNALAAPAGNAAGTGTAVVTSVRVKPGGGIAAGAGAGQAAAAKVQPAAGTADTADQGVPPPSVKVNPGGASAAAAGAAEDATVSIPSPELDADAVTAIGGGVGEDADAAVGGAAAVSTGTGSAQGPGIGGASAGQATATATASDARSSGRIAAGANASSGAAEDAAPLLEAAAGQAVGGGTAANVASELEVPVEAADGTGAAADPTVDIGTRALAETATGTGTGETAGGDVRAATEAATATGAAADAGVLAGTLVAAGTATATGAAADAGPAIAGSAGSAGGTGSAGSATVGGIVAPGAGGGRWYSTRPNYPPVLPEEVTARAGTARGRGTAAPAATEWNDDETVIALLGAA